MIGLLALLLAAAVASAQFEQPAGSRPEVADRVVRVFDFEESTTNPFPVPRFWFRAFGDTVAGARDHPLRHAGFPPWNQARLDYTVAASGGGSVHLPTNGGSTCLRLDPGVIPIFEGGDYRVAALVRTQGLVHARARVVARFLDKANRPIAASEVVSAPVRPADWTPVVVTIRGDYPGAAFLQIDLMLQQPVQYVPAALGRHQIWSEDFTGGAWFDDVKIVQLPRVEMTTGSPANIVVAPDRPSIRTLVRDLTGEALRTRLTLYDMDGRVVDSVVRTVDASGQWSAWAPQAPAFGWYRATMDVIGGSGRVSSAFVDFVWLPPARRSLGLSDADRLRFGLRMSRHEPARVADVVHLFTRSGAGAVAFPIWRAGLEAADVPAAINEVLPLVTAAVAAGQEPSFTLDEPPRALVAAAAVSIDDAIGVFSAPESSWEPFIDPFVEKFAQSVTRWQLGQVGIDHSARIMATGAGLGGLSAAIARLVAGPVLALPWPAELPRPLSVPGAPGSSGAWSLPIPPAMPAAAVAALLSEADPADETGMELVLATLPVDLYSRRDVSIDLARRVIEGWAAGQNDARFAITEPWTWVGLHRSQPMPAVEYAVWRHLADRLSGRRVVGRLPIAPGVTCYILAPRENDPGRAGALVAWRDSVSSSDAVLDAYLGSAPVLAVDLFGNEAPVPTRPAGTTDAGNHVVHLDEAPVFLEGVDVELARFVSTVRLDPSFVRPTLGEREHAIVVQNPWPELVTGRLAIVEPGGGVDNRDSSWRVTPRRSEFSIVPGGSVRIPITVGFGPAEESGVKDFVLDFRLETRKDYGTLRVRTPLEIGLKSINLELTSRSAPNAGGPDLIVEAQVTNLGDQPLTAELTAYTPADTGFARSKASVSALPPGKSAVFRFPFVGGTEKLRGRSVIVAIQDVETGLRVNRAIKIE